MAAEALKVPRDLEGVPLSSRLEASYAAGYDLGLSPSHKRNCSVYAISCTFGALGNNLRTHGERSMMARPTLPGGTIAPMYSVPVAREF